MDPIPVGTKIGDVFPNEDPVGKPRPTTPIVGVSKPVQVISRASFDFIKPRVLQVAEKAIEEKRFLLEDEIKDLIALPVKAIEEEPIIETP